MCIGVPMQVAEPGAGFAWCEGRGQRERIDMLIVGDQDTGTWVLVFAGTARRVIGAQEAAQTDAALDALEAVFAGAQDFDGFFGDILDQAAARAAREEGVET